MKMRNELYQEICEVAFGSRGLFDIDQIEKDDLRQLLLVDTFRQRLCAVRMKRMLKDRGLSVLERSSGKSRVMPSGKTTIEHNLEGLFNDTSSARSSRLIKPLSCIERFRPLELNNRPNGVLKDINIEVNIPLLCIGPRTEAEIFLLWANGFALEKITAIDLISYSPLINLGDMHNIPYNDDSFDCIVCSCTLVYSSDIELAVKEIKRVVKPGGVIAIMIDVANSEYEIESKKLFGRPLFDPITIAELFYGNQSIIYYRHFENANLSRLNGTSSVCIFSHQIAKDG
jgi:SAM-dependent methyltransferase